MIRALPSSPWRNLRLFLRRNPLATLGLVLLGLMVLGSLLAPLLTPYPPTRVDILHKLEPPSLSHPLGTDFFGRDILSRILHGGRNTLSIGFLVVGIAFALGVPLGIVAGFRRGRFDAWLMRLVDAWLSFPTLVMAIALAAAFGPSLTNAMLAVAISMVPQFIRLARAQALAVASLPYVEAAQSLGSPEWRIALRHILPNSLGPLLVQASLNLGSAILQTASLGFLGLGAQPPLAEWGADVAANTPYLRESPWVALAPGMAILVTVVGVNLLGDALVDWLNPRSRRSS
jgi:peptide/nickel transport system permease protein